VQLLFSGETAKSNSVLSNAIGQFFESKLETCVVIRTESQGKRCCLHPLRRQPTTPTLSYPIRLTIPAVISY